MSSVDNKDLGKSADRAAIILSQWEDRGLPRPDASAMMLPLRIQRLARFVTTTITENLSCFGLELWQFDVLATLYRANIPVSAGQLATCAMISQPALTNRVDKLVHQGLVDRRVDPDNRRRVLITLTDEGKRLVENVLKKHIRVCEDCTPGLSLAERDALNMLLAKSLKILEIGDMPAPENH